MSKETAVPVLGTVFATRRIMSRLTAQAALNSYSWSELNDDLGDTGETFFVPYSITQIFPQSGPSRGGTDVIIEGRGFVESESGTDQPR